MKKNQAAIGNPLRIGRAGIFAILVLLVALPGLASAGTVYVAPAGRDSNSGTMARPVQTIARAVELAVPGDTIYLRGGRYDVDHFIFINKPELTVVSYPGEYARVVGPVDDQRLIAIFVIVASHVSLLNMEIQGGAYYGVKVDVEHDLPAQGVAIRNCRIHDTGHDCIKTFDADGLVIEDCEIGPSGLLDPSNAEGIDSIGSVGVTIRRCYIHDSATNGLYLKGGARDGLIESCRIERTHGFSGILLGQDTDSGFMRDGAKYEAINCTARNNIVAHTGAAGLGTYSGFNVRFENNTLYDVASQIQAGFWVVTNTRHVPAEHVSFVNNIVVIQSGRPFTFVKDLGGQLIAESNIYYGPGGAYEFRHESSALVQRWSFADWKKGMNVDEHSAVANPLLDTGHLYRPLPGSPAIGRGVVLSGVTSDYAGSTRPAGAGCDIGAFQVSCARGVCPQGL
ncbi:MAG TPA: right-handed parallel beta-helix repeat-containing protein [Blastocatellia bacterium]|nr:right-handed parallel beta-helix repeat-containing protein [Blastocatellia bacterium]